MASGNPVVEVLRITQPGATADHATPATRLGGSTPAEVFTLWEFDDTTQETLDFFCRLSEDYDGGGLRLLLPWSASSAVSGTVRWEAAVRRLGDELEDVDTSHAYDYNNVDDTAPGTNGHIAYAEITFSDGADMDSWSAGEWAIVRVRRDPSVGGDMTGNAQLWSLAGVEQ